MTACPSCGAALETPLGCTACGVLLQPAETPDPFQVFGLTPAWDMSGASLKRKLMKLQKLAHPDFHGTAHSAQQELAESHAAAINHAYEVLERPFLRADWLVGLLGGPDEQAERQMPQVFLMEVLEWNEALDDAEATPAGSPERAALETLARELHEQRDEQLNAIGTQLTPLPEPGAPVLAEVRRALNAVRYLSRALWRIRELRLAEPTAGGAGS